MGGRRRELRRRYLSLGTGELAAAAVFAGLAVVVVMPQLEGDRDHAALWSALTPLLVVLVQAGTYWLMARTWVTCAPMPASAAAVYRVFRAADPVLLAAGLVGVVLWWPGDTGTALLVVAVWAFGVVEYVNYFVVRLSYPPHRWSASVTRWRTPRLVQDLGQARSTVSGAPDSD